MATTTKKLPSAGTYEGHIFIYSREARGVVSKALRQAKVEYFSYIPNQGGHTARYMTSCTHEQLQRLNVILTEAFGNPYAGWDSYCEQRFVNDITV